MDDSPPKRVSMQTLAEACGVSRMAVSLALRGQHGISDRLRVRIQKKAQEMGYRYDANLSKLTSYLAERNRKQVTRGEIPFVITVHPDVGNLEGHAMWMPYLQKTAEHNGYRLERYDYDNTPTNRRRLERIWRSRGVQGIIFSHLYMPTHPPKLTWKDFSWVAIGRNFRNPTLNRVDLDHRRAIHECAKHLHQLGYQRIGFIIPRSYDKALDFIATGAARGYQSCIPKDRRVPLFETDRIGNPKLTHKLLQDWITKYQPDAILTGGHETYYHLQELGYKFPRDLAYACWQLNDINPDGISGINPGYQAFGKATVELLLSQILHNVKGVPSHPGLTLVSGEWNPGATVRKSRKRTPLPPELR